MTWKLRQGGHFATLHRNKALHASPLSCPRYHFDSLAHDNSALTSTLENVALLDTSTFPVPPPLPDAAPNAARLGRTPSPWILSGLQVVPKFGRVHDPPHTVRIHLAVWRLRPLKDVDLVVSFNIPRADSAPGGPAVSVEREEAIMTELFHKAATTLNVEDWNLFQQ